MSANFADQVDGVFASLHTIILSFIFRLGVFLPALTNAVLVGFAINAFASGRWGQPAGFVSGLVAGGAIEVGGVVLSWNLKAKKWSSWFVMALYLIGSWLLVWLGLADGFLTNIVGFIMPIFAVATQATIANWEQSRKAQAEAREAEELRLAQLKEETKQERAKARAAKAQNFSKNDAKMSKNEAFAWLKQNPATPTAEAANELGVTLQTVRNYRREMGEVQNGKLNELV